MHLQKFKSWKALSMLMLIIALGCSKKEKDMSADIIRKSVEANGGTAYDSMQLAFNFRQFAVELTNINGQYTYQRVFKDSADNLITDQLKNEGFTRKINGEVVTLNAKLLNAAKESLNSVAYFALLPYKLSEPAVQAKQVGTITIDDNDYYKIKITFKKDGGGKDHTDEFCYWINKANYNMEYIAYTNGGPRFRKLLRQHRNKSGIILQDYNNYAMVDSTIDVINYDSAFLTGKMKLLSLIEHSNVR